MRYWLLWIVLLGVGATSARAEPMASGLEGLGRQVSDNELAEHRGKFIASDGIRYFGIRMHTTWTDASGTTTAATLLFTLNFEGKAGDIRSAVPILLAGFTRDGESGTLLSGDANALAQGAFDVGSGAVQTLQIAGSDNRAHNAMRISILPASQVSAHDGQGLSAIGGSEQFTFADGDQLQFLVQPGEIGLLLTGGTADHSLQSFGGSGASATQDVALGSNNNSLFNDMNIVIGHDFAKGGGQISIQNSLLSLQGL